jgi:two-component system NtrC family sensor kinase
MLSAEVAGEQARRYAAYIDKSVAEAAHIIRQLLQLSKPHAGVVQAIDLRTVVDETLVMLRFQSRQARCEIGTRLPSEPVWVLAEPGQLKQIALNLSLNALQATEGGADAKLGIEVRISEEHAWLVVTDNGCGIPPENLPRIFDPFFTTKGPERGTGLGLSVCYSIVRQHGGDILVESKVGEGTTFTVTLPRERTAPAVMAAPGVPEGISGRALEAGRGARVLVVDDEDVVSKLLQELLRTRFGCQVDLAATGAAALALADDTHALVLSDIQMPVMNGLEFYRQLSAAKPALARRFVFLTGHPGGRALEAEIAACNVPVLAKPFTLTRLTAACEPFLAKARVAEE